MKKEIYMDRPITGATEKEALLNALKFLADYMGFPPQCEVCGAMIPVDDGNPFCPDGCDAGDDD